MHENQDVNIVSRYNIKPLIQLCLQTELDRGLSKNSIIELKRYLNEFSTYCECQNIYSVKDLTLPFLKDYIDQRSKSAESSGRSAARLSNSPGSLDGSANAPEPSRLRCGKSEP